jgi:trimeric autotransporter adhesin
MLTTLISFWSAQSAAASAALSQAQAALTAAQTNSGNQRARLGQANQELAALSKQEAKIRADLAASPTEADGKAVAVLLGAAITAKRAKEAEILSIMADIDAAQTALDVATGNVTAATSQNAAAQAAAAAAKQEDKDRTALKDALTKPPLQTMAADAAAALAGQPYLQAKARLGADIPAKLLDCARERAGVERGRLDLDAQQVSALAQLIQQAGPEGEKLRTIFQSAEGDLRDYVLNAKRDFDAAMVVMTRVADPKQNALTQAESKALQSQQDDGSTNDELKTKREDAAAKRLDLATAQADYRAKEAALALARLQARAQDVDADPETAADVVAAQTDFTSAKTALNKAQNDFTGDMQADLAEWEAAVPDATWRMLADFDAASQRLNELKANPASKAGNLTAKEKDLVTALVAADKSGRTLKMLQTEAAQAEALTKFDAGIADRRILSAMRGDS